MTVYSKITGTGSYLPANRVSNDQLAEQLAAQGVETSDEDMSRLAAELGVSSWTPAHWCPRRRKRTRFA